MGRSSRHSHKKKPVGDQNTVHSGRCVSIGAKGDGEVVLDNGESIFVPYTAPGDEGVFEKSGRQGRVVSLDWQGQDRVEPPCPKYQLCGGCQLQHVSDEFQRNWKKDLVMNALVRSEVSAPDIDGFHVSPLHSRRRAVFGVTKNGNDVTIGFNARKSSRIVDIEGCIVLDKAILSALEPLRRLSRHLPADAFDIAVTSVQGGIDVAVRSRRLRYANDDYFLEVTRVAQGETFLRVSINGELVFQRATPMVSFGDVAVPLPPGGFLQASVDGEAAIADAVLLGVGDAKRVADLFAGSGTLSLRLAAAGKRVVAIDAEGPAIEALKSAAKIAHGQGIIRHPVAAETRDLDERPLLAKELEKHDAVVFDPPRAGAAAQAIEIAQSKIKTVVGVSCNPSTFARDAKILKDGGYTLSRLTLIDQFIHAAHVELVGVFLKA
ncbi:MAG: RsmD family RNA methyltransferase [Pseudomonadota bacterium]